MHIVPMGNQAVIMAFSALTAVQAAYAHSRVAVPAAPQVIAALNEKSESDLYDYLRDFPPGTVAAHVIQVDTVTKLTCMPVSAPDRVRCHFVAHQGSVDRETSATMVRRDGVWHISDE